MIVECISKYQDTVLNKLVEVGSTMEVDDNRGAVLIRAKVAKEIVKVEDKPKPKKKVAKEAK